MLGPLSCWNCRHIYTEPHLLLHKAVLACIIIVYIYNTNLRRDIRKPAWILLWAAGAGRFGWAGWREGGLGGEGVLRMRGGNSETVRGHIAKECLYNAVQGIEMDWQLRFQKFGIITAKRSENLSRRNVVRELEKVERGCFFAGSGMQWK